MEEKSVYIVTYRDIGGDPVITLFDNEEAASKCYKYFKTIHTSAWIDKCLVYNDFKINKEKKGLARYTLI